MIEKYTTDLTTALSNYSNAVKMAINALPKDDMITFLTHNIEKPHLELLLSQFEEKEEYEYCLVIASALNQFPATPQARPF